MTYTHCWGPGWIYEFRHSHCKPSWEYTVRSIYNRVDRTWWAWVIPEFPDPVFSSNGRPLVLRHNFRTVTGGTWLIFFFWARSWFSCSAAAWRGISTSISDGSYWHDVVCSSSKFCQCNNTLILTHDHWANSFRKGLGLTISFFVTFLLRMSESEGFRSSL